MHLMLIASALALTPMYPRQAAPAVQEVHAATAGDEIVVTGRRESTFDLARLARAQATFVKHRAAYAPASVLYFEVRPSHGVILDGFKLTLRAGERTVDVPLNASHRFTLPFLPRGDWELVHNRGRKQVALRALVLSPGALETDRPLGDLRLQCRVGRSLNGNEMSFKQRLVFDVVGGCTSKRVALHFYTPRPVARAILARGDTFQDLSVDWDGRRYLVPANDTTLPNSARVRLVYR